MIKTSAPCRIDMGGTLDIKTFYYPLKHLNPCTFNIAIDLRTTVCVSPHHRKTVRISSKGFEDAEYAPDELPFDHPMGLMFAIAAYFRADSIHIEIESSSPPRSALGGSSVAAAALIFALSKYLNISMNTAEIVKLAHEIEESVAGVPCGMQDQLAAAYGGVNAWYWQGSDFEQKNVVHPENFESNLLLAYCGIPHESKNINGKWVKDFLSGKYRKHWTEIIRCTQNFIKAISLGNFKAAADAMNKEVAIRIEMTPDVLDNTGEKLVQAAIAKNCGARFTGAGGGGCLWAVGSTDLIAELKPIWNNILLQRDGAYLLPAKIADQGLLLSVFPSSNI